LEKAPGFVTIVEPENVEENVRKILDF